MASRASLLAVAMVAFAVAAEVQQHTSQTLKHKFIKYFFQTQAQMPPPPPPMVLIPGLPALPPIPPKYMKKVQKMFMQAMKYGVEYYESSGSEDTCGGDRTPREIMTGMPIKEGCKTVSFANIFIRKVQIHIFPCCGFPSRCCCYCSCFCCCFPSFCYCYSCTCP